MTTPWRHGDPAGRYHATLLPPRPARREQAKRDAADMLAAMQLAGGALRNGRLDRFDARIMNRLASIAGEPCPYPSLEA